MSKHLAALIFMLLQAATLAWGGELEPDPFDGYSSPVHYSPRFFSGLCAILPREDVPTRAAHFLFHEVVQTVREGTPWARWHFKTRPGQAVLPTLRFNDDARHAPLGYTLTIDNAGTQPVVLSGRLSADAATVTLGPGTRQRVDFETPELILNVLNPASDREYDLYLRDLTIHYPEAPHVKTRTITIPEAIEAGGEFEVRLEAEGCTVGQVLDLELRHDPWIIWRIRLSDSERNALAATGRCALVRAIPATLCAGEATVGLVEDGFRAAGAEATLRVVNTHAPGLPAMTRRLHNGRPTFFRNGQPFTWTGYAVYQYQPGCVAEFGASGTDLFFIPTDAGRHVHQVAAPTWHGGGDYDFGELEQRVATALQANPQASLILRISLCLPPVWLQEYPGSVVRIRTPGGDLAWEETGSRVASLASPDWRRQQEEVLRQFVRYCASRPWADRVVCFFPTGEVTEEWFAWACNDNQFADYSPANEQGFAQWCARRGYPSRRVPDPSSRIRPGYDLFPDDETGRAAAAYSQYYSELTAETIGHFASVIKDETGRRSLVGTFYGYVMQLAGSPRQHNAGNMDLRRVIDHPDVDFIAGIPLHNFRLLTGRGYDTSTTALESILAAGKLYNNEDDLFSWLHNAHWRTLYNPQDPRGGAIAMHRRVLGNDIVHGNSRQWFSLSPLWHHDRALQDEFARQIALQQTAPGYDRTPVEEVALLIDDTSFSWFSPDSTLANEVQNELLAAIGHTGAPVGVWLLSDLDRLPERIRFVVVASGAAALPADIAKLEQALERGGRTFLVIGAPGLIDPLTQRRDPEAPARILGLPIRVEDRATSAVAYRVDTGAPTCTIPGTVRPCYYSDQAGSMLDGEGRPAAGERPLPGGGRLLWCALPPSRDVALLRGWLEEACVHCYGPVNTFAYASREIVSITSVLTQDAEIPLTWPQVVTVMDLYDGWQGQGREILCPFAPGQTRLFHVKPFPGKL